MKTRTIVRVFSPSRQVPVVLAMLAGVALSGVASAEIPSVLDRVATDAPVVVTIRSIDDLVTRYEPLFNQMRQLEMNGEDPFKVVKAVRAIKGVDSKRPVAMVMTKLNDAGKGEGAAEGEPGMVERNDEGVVLLPVTSYAEFVDATGGKASEKVTKLSLGDEVMYARDGGGGYAAVSNKMKAVESYTPATGQLGAHTKALGVVGGRVADTCDVLVISNFSALKGKIEEGVADMDKELAGGMPPGMDQMKAGMDFMKDMAKAVARDGSVGVLGLSKTEAGIVLDGAAQFKEGTETASKFKVKGNSSSSVARLPSKPFLIAGAMDLSSPAMKSMLGELAKAGKAAAGDKADADPMNWFGNVARNIETTDGAGFLIGATDNMAAGLLVNSASYTASKDPAALLASMRTSHLGVHGKTINGMTFANEWKAGEKEIAGAGKADVYSSKITIDQNDPNAFMASMGLGMMFGDQGGMSGFAMATKSGVVMTMSQNAPLMSSAMEAATGGNGLGTIDTVKSASAMLPEHRVGEMYLGTKEIVNAIAQAAGAFGGLDLHFTMPEKVSAIGMGATMDGEGMQVRVAIPQDAFDTILSVVKQAKAQNDEMMGGEPAGEGAKQPKF